MVVLLTIAGGGVDAIVIMGFNVLTAAQTGNTILLAVAIAQGKIALGVSAAVSVFAFVTGAALGQILLSSSPPRFRFACPLGLEAALLLILIAIWQVAEPSNSRTTELTLIACAAAAMGIQSAIILDLHARSTTYITGMLSGLITAMVRAGMRRHAVQPPVTGNDTAWIAGVAWLTYLAAAVVSGLVFLRFGGLSLILPLLAIAWVIGLSTRRATSDSTGI